MITYPIYIPLPVQRNTTAGWASDTNVYPAGMHLQVTDDFYTGTDQCLYKIANGLDPFSALDFMPSGINMYNSSGTASGTYTNTLSNYSFNFTSVDGLLNFTSTGEGGITSTTENGIAYYGVSENSFAGQFVSNQSDAVSVSAPFGIGIFSVGNIGVAGVGDSSGVIGTSTTGNGGTFSSDNGIGIESNSTTDVGAQITSNVNKAILSRGSVYIETNGTGGTFEPSAVLALSSTTQGFKPPRGTTAQRNAIAAVDGLIFDDSDTGSLWRKEGANWIEL